MEEKLSVASVTGVDIELTIAGPGGRSYAFVIDWHIRFLLGAAWFVAGSYLYTGAVSLLPDLQAGFGAYTFTVLIPAAGIYFLYHPLLELLMNGRTPGKRMAGVRVVTTDGRTPDAGAILIRNVFRLIDHLPALYAIGLVTTMFTSRSVRVGDLAAGTVLVYDDPRLDSPSLARIGEAAVANLGLERAEIAHEVLDRWEELEQAARMRMAHSILSACDPPPPDDADDGQLRQRLAALLE